MSKLTQLDICLFFDHKIFFQHSYLVKRDIYDDTACSVECVSMHTQSHFTSEQYLHNLNTQFDLSSFCLFIQMISLVLLSHFKNSCLRSYSDCLKNVRILSLLISEELSGLPLMSFSTSVLQRCRQVLSECSSSSLTLCGAGSGEQSTGGRHCVKGLCIGVRWQLDTRPSEESASSGLLARAEN